MLLKLDKVSKSFGGLKAVDEVTYEFEENHIHGLIGPNGAGKTTLVNLLSGLITPTSGTIRFRGQELNNKTPEAITHRGIARTFQVVRVFRSLSVLDNVMTGALFGKGGVRRKDAKERAEAVIEDVGLSEHVRSRADELPLAYQKRLQIARALATEPEFLILDEAMAGLNSREVEDAIELLFRIRERDITLLIIEHLMKVIMNVSDVVLVLHQGKLLATGSPREVSDNPEVVQAYFGERYRR
jgi:branched-chain amino acid transport system ATP-binding protein